MNAAGKGSQALAEMKVLSGRLPIHYVEAGSGEQAILFLHGMACDHTDWRKQIPHFSPRYRVIAIDQRGHGQTPNPGGVMRVEEIADDAAWVCRELGLKKPIVIGHSYGGLITLALGAQHPDLAHALVMLDTSMDQPQELRDWMQNYYDTMTPDSFADVVLDHTMSRVHDPGDDPAVAAHNVRMLQRFGYERFIATGRSILAYGDCRPSALKIKSPTLWVSATRPFADPAVVHQTRPDWYLGRTVGAGHWHQVLVADQVNAMIDAFLAQIRAGYPASPPWPC